MNGYRLLLMRLGLLEALGEEQISALQQFLTQRELAAGEILFRQGERCEHLHLIQHGALRLSAETNGALRALEIVSAGQALGEVAVFLSMPYPCTAEAVQESLVASLHQDDLRRLASGPSGFAWQLLRLLSRRLMGMQVRVQALTSSDVRVRVGTVLLQLARDSMPLLRDGPVTLRLRQEEIAQMAGVSRETVSRVLGQWSAEGLLSVGRGSVTLPDLGRFQAMLAGLSGGPSTSEPS